MWFKYNQIFQLSEKDFWNVTLQGWCGWRQKMAKLKWSWVFWLNITLLKLPSKHCLLPSLSESGTVQFYSFEHSAVQTFAQSAHFLFRYLNYLAHWSGILALHSNTPSAGYLFLFFRTHVSAQGDLCFCLRVHCTHLSSTHCTYLSETQDPTVQHSATQSNTGGRRVSPGGSLLPPLFMFCTGCTSVPAYAAVSGVCTFQ